MLKATVAGAAIVSTAAMTCPGSGAWLGHAKTQVSVTTKASCADVKAEILARAGAQGGWTDPHNGGIYSVLSSTGTEIETKRTTNPKHAVGGMTYTDKQTFTLTEQVGSCFIEACSESQGSSLKDFSTNYCDIRNLYCGRADGCSPISKDFAFTQTSVTASSGQSDWSACIVKSAPKARVAAAITATPIKCPGSGAWLGHAKTQVTTHADASCADVKAEILARAGAQGGWTDPHNGGIYSVLSSSDAYQGVSSIETKRDTNPKHSVGGMTYTDKQTFTLTVDPQEAGKCIIDACSESQGSSLKDFSTNYCDVRNLYCGKADGCTTVSKDFASKETFKTASSGQSDWSDCIVKSLTDTAVHV